MQRGVWYGGFAWFRQISGEQNISQYQSKMRMIEYPKLRRNQWKQLRGVILQLAQGLRNRMLDQVIRSVIRPLTWRPFSASKVPSVQAVWHVSSERTFSMKKLNLTYLKLWLLDVTRWCPSQERSRSVLMRLLLSGNILKLIEGASFFTSHFPWNSHSWVKCVFNSVRYACDVRAPCKSKPFLSIV